MSLLFFRFLSVISSYLYCVLTLLVMCSNRYCVCKNTAVPVFVTGFFGESGEHQKMQTKTEETVHSFGCPNVIT